ncbi:MAG: MFS transporter [Gammaproteobacteria bacterium]|nr:MFS transporter [Gammaproteobacteria bacterium]
MAAGPVPTPGSAPADAIDKVAPGDPPWPAPRIAWYAAGVFALALMFAMLDRGVFSLMMQQIKQDFGLSDIQAGMLLGPAGILFYVFIGIPMARLVDIYPRNIVLSAGMLVTNGITAVCGLVQSFGQLFLCRMVVGVGGSAHGPGTYSMMADYFPPRRLPRAIAVLQAGFIAGTGLSMIIGGLLLGITADWEPTRMGGLLIRNWQWVLIGIGLPGLIATLLVRLLPEPPRRGKISAGRSLPLSVVANEAWRRRGVYGPLFIGLALSSIEAGGLAEWRPMFLQRSYGWTPQQVGLWTGMLSFITSPLGVILGTWLTERLGRRYKDTPLRVTCIVWSMSIPFLIAAPLMPTGELAVIVGSLSGLFSMASAVPQNVAIQTITPNEMRGQVTAMYLFMFTVFQAIGSVVIAAVTQYVLRDESKLWLSMVITAAIFMPAAALTISRGLKHYASEVRALEARGVL